ncbi:MAG: hypothetical protein DI598_05970 [Pseudopedobacter saltans]|uniref:N-acetyltransferase domain-containing protein n=1 Tax=Pseudopedobacter saltans TaxID=151895 RepID=A0A2W5H8X2_9SPHI|nr:MAG: hypothetical protein DI598_05970 [Pseudopedobacter saltans]
MSIHIVKVDNKKLLKSFIDFPHDLYKGDPNYVPELFIAQRDLLTPGKNPFFETGRLQLFLAYKGNEIVGRIAAIYNANYIKFLEKNDGFFGFFESINDQEVANLLLEEAYVWLRAQGIKGNMLGPANPTSNDSWGVQIDGFDSSSMVMMPYNFPYYQSLLEKYGMTKNDDLFAYIFDLEAYNGEKAKRMSVLLEERLKTRNNIIIRQIDLKHNFKKEVEKIRKVYNIAWDKNQGSVPLTESEFDYVAKDLKMIVDPNFCYVAEQGDEIIGICIAIPNINEILKNIKRGRLFPTGLIKLLTQKKNITSLRIMILGVLEPYRKLGIEACFYAALMRHADAHSKMKTVEASWILEQNTMMNRAIIDTGGVRYKTYRVFEKAIK